MNVPTQAIAPLKERLMHLRAQPSTPELVRAIQETEALIKRLENSNGTRCP